MDDLLIQRCPIEMTIKKLNSTKKGGAENRPRTIYGGAESYAADRTKYKMIMIELQIARGEWSPTENLVAATLGNILLPIETIGALILKLESIIMAKIFQVARFESVTKTQSGILNMTLPPTPKPPAYDVADPSTVRYYVETLVDYLDRLSCGLIGPICSAQQMKHRLDAIESLQFVLPQVNNAESELAALDSIQVLEDHYGRIIEALSPIRQCLEAIVANIKK